MLPLRLVTSDLRRSATVVSVCFVTLVALRIATGLGGWYVEELERQSRLWPGEISVSRVPADGFGDAFFTDDEIAAVAAAARELGLETRNRISGVAWIQTGARVDLTRFVAVRPDDPLLHARSLQPVEPDSIDRLFISAGTDESTPIEIDRFSLVGAGSFGGRPGSVTAAEGGVAYPAADTLIVLNLNEVHRSLGEGDRGANLMVLSTGTSRENVIVAAYDAGQLLGEGYLVRPWQEVIGIDRYSAASRLAGNISLLLAIVAAVGVAGAVALAVTDRQSAIVTLRSFGFRTDSIRAVFVREVILLATIAATAAGLCTLAGQAVFSWWVPTEGLGRLLVGTIVVLPLVALAATRRATNRSLAELRREETA